VSSICQIKRLGFAGSGSFATQPVSVSLARPITAICKQVPGYPSYSEIGSGNRLELLEAAKLLAVYKSAR
jgi:hypothetical protein